LTNEPEGVVHIVAYDQLRYLKNRDTYIYGNKRASDVVRMIALDYKLRLGQIAQTQFIIPHRIEDNVTLTDIIGNALDFELERSGHRYVLSDEFGRLSLKNEAQMFSGVQIHESTVGRVSFFSSVDNRSTRVKISRFNGKNSGREIAVASDTAGEERFGVLQYYAKSNDKEEILGNTAERLLRIHNRDSRRIILKDAIGDVSVRGGSGIVLDLSEFKGRATVTRCLHKLSANSHFMDLEVVM
jgi:hypothetical protein